MHKVIQEKDTPGKVLLFVFTVLLLLVVWPFLLPVFWALVTCILLQPLWRKMERSTGLSSTARALLIILAIILIIFVPTILLIISLPAQINSLIEVLPQYQKTFTDLINNLISHLPASLGNEIRSAMNSPATEGMGDFGRAAINVVQSAASSTFSMFVSFGVMLYVLFFFLTDGPRLYQSIKSYLPFTDELITRLSERFVGITKASVLGVFVIALAQGAVAGVIYWILGVQAPIALGVATTIVSLIPAVGSGLIWVPVSIFLAVNGEVTKAVIMFAAGFFVIAMVDNLLRPRLVGRSAKIPDWVIMVTTLGGLALIGGSGIVIGPMIAGICLSLWQMTKPQPDEGDLVLTPASTIDSQPETAAPLALADKPAPKPRRKPKTKE